MYNTPKYCHLFQSVLLKKDEEKLERVQRVSKIISGLQEMLSSRGILKGSICLACLKEE